jgi:hypothetical protein
MLSLEILERETFPTLARKTMGGFYQVGAKCGMLCWKSFLGFPSHYYLRPDKIMGVEGLSSALT